jgi:hypothetical protein
MDSEPNMPSGNVLNEIEPGVWDQIIADRAQYDPVSWLQRNRPDVLEKFNAIPYLGINQIKGPGNGMPDADALPFIQEFVKSGKWAYVKDLQNAGLTQLDPNSDLARAIRAAGQEVPEYLTNKELTELRNKFPVGYAKGGLASKSNVERVLNDNRRYLG